MSHNLSKNKIIWLGVLFCVFMFLRSFDKQPHLTCETQEAETLTRPPVKGTTLDTRQQMKVLKFDEEVSD